MTAPIPIDLAGSDYANLPPVILCICSTVPLTQEPKLMNRRLLIAVFGCMACIGTLAGWLAGQTPPEKPAAEVSVELPDPPVRISDAAERAEACLECHQEIEELLEGDKHIADDFHCVVCHGTSKAHLEMEVEGTLPDRTWRRWVEDDNSFEWRIKNAPLEIAKFCSSCHGRKPAQGQQMKTINWEDYLATGHGQGVHKGSRDAPTCTDCHYAHGAGCEALTDETIVDRCATCHADEEMMDRAGLDSNVISDFEADAHQDMDSVPAADKSSCIKCHYPH